MTSGCEKEQPDALRVRAIVDYVASRQNADGRYAFAARTELSWMDIEEALKSTRIAQIFQRILNDFSKQKSERPIS